jgi:hypothetical protein
MAKRKVRIFLRSGTHLADARRKLQLHHLSAGDENAIVYRNAAYMWDRVHQRRH